MNFSKIFRILACLFKSHVYYVIIFYFIITILATEDISNIQEQHSNIVTIVPNSSLTEVPVSEKSLFNITFIPQQSSVTSNPCFYADQEYCTNQTIFEYQNNEKYFQPYCRCRSYPNKINAYVCCNITDIMQVTSCYKGNWTYIHMRNVTMRTFNISLSILKAATSVAITDGNIKYLSNEFYRHAKLKCLNVSNNNLTQIDQRALINLNNFQMLDISYNNLTKVPNLSHHRHLTVDVRGNQRILCDSLSDSFNRGSVNFKEAETTPCVLNTTFTWFNSTETMPISQLERYVILDDECPKPENRKCKCAPSKFVYASLEGTKLVYSAHVDCSNLGLTKLPDKLPANTVLLNVSNNNITSFENKLHSSYYEKLLIFDADNNHISSMYELEGAKFITQFHQFFLRMNDIDYIPEYIVSNALDHNPNGIRLYLGGNKLKCDCNSAIGLKYWLLQNSASIPDYKEILCNNLPQTVVELTDKELCQSPHDWTDYIYYLIASEVFLLLALIFKVSYDYWKLKTFGYLPWPASKMPKLPCDWLCEP